MVAKPETYTKLGIRTATVNAIYALLLTGSDWLNTQNTCVATWDGKTYSTAEGEIAIGYLKTILPNEPANSSANPVLSIRKEGNTPAWGAVYEQYFQEIDKVKGQKGVLSVEKKLFVETNNGTNRQIRPITPEQTAPHRRQGNRSANDPDRP